MPTDPPQNPDNLLKAEYDRLKREYDSLKREPVADSKEAQADFQRARANICQLVDPTARSQPATGIDKALFLYAVEKSLAYLAGYASLNLGHISDLVALQRAVETYGQTTYQKNLGDIRPENWLITSNPGEGKSHLVSCIAKAALKDKDNLVSFNMASMRTADDLIQVLDEVRNVAITGKLPMLFLDEVDNKDDNFGLLLPLLWDGEIQVGIRRIRIGRAVIVAAGSKPYLLDRSNKDAPSKLRDFRSRLKFDTKIPELTPVDQVCIAIAVLRHMYEDDKGSEVLSVPVSLLNFIYDIKFYYGVRSIKHLINYLCTGDKIKDIKDGVLNIDRLEKALSTPELADKSGLL